MVVSPASTGLSPMQIAQEVTTNHLEYIVLIGAWIDTVWENETGGTIMQHSRARDLLTPEDVSLPAMLTEDRFTARLTLAREVLRLRPTQPGPA